ELVERALAEQHDELDTLERARPAVDVVVHQPTAGKPEALVQATELVPDRTGAEQAAALARRTEQPPAPGAGRGADLEQPVAVGLPARLGEQPVFRRLVVARVGSLHVTDGPDVECRGGDYGPGSEAGGTPGFGQEAR